MDSQNIEDQKPIDLLVKRCIRNDSLSKWQNHTVFIHGRYSEEDNPLAWGWPRDIINIITPSQYRLDLSILLSEYKNHNNILGILYTKYEIKEDQPWYHKIESIDTVSFYVLIRSNTYSNIINDNRKYVKSLQEAFQLIKKYGYPEMQIEIKLRNQEPIIVDIDDDAMMTFILKYGDR